MPNRALLTTKLHIPPLRSDYVPRPRLVKRLQDGLARRVTILSTPPGFGKTTLLCEWLKQNELQAAWVSLDEGDNDHGRFITYVMAALRTLDTAMDEHILAISQAAAQGIPIESPMVALLNDFAALPSGKTPFILVLDDYHVIQNPTVHNSMAFALDYIPENIHIVIASRSDPPLPLSRLRARHQFNELRVPDLRFTRTETEAFLNQASGLALSPTHVAALDDRTEGWAAGLQLAALALSGRSDIDHFVRDFTGSHRYVLDYLADEVFSRQSPETCDFLLKTSILERMTPDLCDALTGKDNSRAMLSRLEHENLFLIPLDEQGRWYRYHHLFVDLLKNRLEHSLPTEILALNHRAALWFEAHNQPNEAIEHALAAHEHNLAIRLMIKATPSLAMRSEIGTLLRWLEALPREMKVNNPRIPLMYAWANFFMTKFDAVELHIREALRVLGLELEPGAAWPADLPSKISNEMLAQVFALRTFILVNHGEPEQGVRVAREALAHLSEGEKVGRFGLLAALGDAYRDADNFSAASQTYTEALAVAEALNLYPASLAMRMDLARLHAKMGHMRYAETICREVLAWESERFHPLFPVVQAYTLLGEILRERNDLKVAEQILAASIRQSEWAGYQRYLVYSLVSLARLKSARGESQAMEQTIEAAQCATAGSEPLRAWVEQFRVRLLKRGESDWLATHPLAESADVGFQREDEALTLARLHLKRNPQSVYRFLERMLISAQQSTRTGSIIEILILQAQALHLLGRLTDALQKFQRALTLAESEGYCRLFVDEGELVAELLLLAIQHDLHPVYASRLLALLKENLPRATNLPETLTERESEVLRLIAAGLSNQEIAQRLTISLSTIKTHVTRIYAKLEVTSRTQAILRARELRLI